MKERKNIDRLYQEKFKDFEATPREAVWKNIAEKLEEKDRKKPLILPLWFKLGGIAAALALIFGLTYFLNTGNYGATKVVFDIDDAAKPSIETPHEANPILDKTSEQLEQVVSSEPETESSSNSSKNDSHSFSSAEGNNSLAQTSSEADRKSSNNSQASAEITAIAENSVQNSAVSEEKGEITEQANTGNKAGLKNPNFITPASGENNSEIAENQATEKPGDAAVSEENNQQGQNELALLEKKKEEEKIITESNESRISISSFAAPIYYDNMGSGNALDTQFANNSSNSDVTLSYGVKVAYAISDKVKIRSGISKVAMSYNTENISYSVGYAPSHAVLSSSDNIRNIEYSSNAQNLSLSSGSHTPSMEAGLVAIAGSSIGSTGALKQKFGFIEVPLEIEYSLIDSKFGLNLIGGGSSLFLDENSISLDADNSSTKIGKATNLNQISFSTNIGLGLDYELSEKFQVNLEPTFKYQLNTFDNTSGVQPYFFGIYSGVSFKF